jgi:predicted dithiol-disulfide oxidoreductase (DUF899 family)
VNNKIVAKQTWLDARRALLEKEKAYMKAGDKLQQELRALPWVKVETNYTFTTPNGNKTLLELFRGRSQMFMKHFMMAPGQDWQCVGCSLECDHMNGLLPHLDNHDISYVVVARAPIHEIEEVRRRMGWDFCWVSSFGSEFNYDMDVSFRPEQLKSGAAQYNFRPYKGEMTELSGNSVFYRDEADNIYLTYQAFARGGEVFMGIFNFLDSVPKGREENGPNHSLTDWARLHNAYASDHRAASSGAISVD